MHSITACCIYGVTEENRLNDFLFENDESMGMAATENNNSNAEREHDAVPADAFVFAFEPRHQVSDGDIDETGGRNRDDVGHPVLRTLQSEVSDDPAEQRSQAGNAIPEQRLGSLPANGEQDGKIARLLRDFMGNDSQRSRPAERWIGEKCSSNQQAIREIMEAVANEDRDRPVTMKMMVTMAMIFTSLAAEVAIIAVRVTPDSVLFECEETKNTCQQDGEDLMRRKPQFERFGQQMQHGSRKQYAYGEADRVIQVAFWQAEQHQRGDQQAENTAGNTGEGNLKKKEK